jgi:hypothetical protein
MSGLTGDMVFLPCGCPCELAHPDENVRETVPIVATLQVVMDLGTGDLPLCEPCYRAAKRHQLALLEDAYHATTERKETR